MKRLSTIAACVALTFSAQAYAGLKSTEIATAQTNAIGKIDPTPVLSEPLAIDSESSFDLVAMEDETREIVQVEQAMPIPEPAAAAILFAGLGSMAWMRYRLG